MPAQICAALFIPMDPSFEPPNPTPSEMLKNLKLERYALKARQDWVPDDYGAVVDESVLNINFEPDIFQKQAFYFLSKKESVFVSAHTSSGKTLVAEYAVGLGLKNSSRTIYTSPIKALSNQKFFDFKQKFSDVGLITGDAQINTNANCLIMTTEILRNLVYRNSELLASTEYVVFDEVHYINDAERGVVWEECIIMLPQHISLVMLSATIPNSLEFAEWVGRTKNRCIYVVSTNKRAVPLEFAVYCDASVFSIDDPRSKKAGSQPSNFQTALPVFSKNIKAVNGFRINDLGNFVNNKGLVPAIFFTFSKKACVGYGKSLQLLDLTTPNEKECILKFLEGAMGNLRDEDRNLPQIRAMRDKVYRGVAVHHGALLPFVKECVEILFSENLIKILVATETFAMGVNMPAKCCVFLSLTKIDNGTFRYLNTGEFIQMSGRAGRRGMDKVGTVLIADQRMPDLSTIKRVVDGIPADLNSKFKLSFSLILTAVITNIAVEDLMRSSFKEHGSQRTLKSDMSKLAALESVPDIGCEQCKDYPEYFSNLSAISRELPPILRNVIRIGDTVVLKNNAVVRIISISKGEFMFANADVSIDCKGLFAQPLTEEIAESSEAVGSWFILKYPIRYRNHIGNGTASFDDVVFYVKGSTISFDFAEIDIKYVCKVSELKSCFENMLKCRFLGCDSFEEHYFEAVRSKHVRDEIHAIRSRYSREGLALMSEYTARMSFLRKHLFLSDSITLKGRAAAEIRTVNDVLVAELIFNNELESFSPSEAISLFSSMINEEQLEEYAMSPELESKADVLLRYYDSLSKDLAEMNIPRFQELNLSCVQAVHDWCSGLSLGSIVAKHRVQEGSLVRLLLRLDECCREMVNVGEIIGDNKISEKFSQASACMRRGIVFLPSLYVE